MILLILVIVAMAAFMIGQAWERAYGQKDQPVLKELCAKDPLCAGKMREALQEDAGLPKSKDGKLPSPQLTPQRKPSLPWWLWRSVQRFNA
jgi:hypothetical protein